MTLENVFPGLSAAAPETIIAVAKHLIAAERNAPRRWFGFGGEVPILNAKGGFTFRLSHIRRLTPMPDPP